MSLVFIMSWLTGNTSFFKAGVAEGSTSGDRGLSESVSTWENNVVKNINIATKTDKKNENQIYYTVLKKNRDKKINKYID